MKTKCLLRDGPADGVVMEVEDGCKLVVIPARTQRTVDGCSLVRHEYTREGAGLFEFVKTVEVPDSAPRSNLDYVLGLRGGVSCSWKEARMKTDAIKTLTSAHTDACISRGIDYPLAREAEAELEALEAENAKLKHPIDQRISDLEKRLYRLNEEACAVARYTTKLETEKAAMRHRSADLAGEILAAAVVEYSDEGMLKFICPPSFETAVRKAAAIGEAALSPPTGKVLVDVEKLRELEWAVPIKGCESHRCWVCQAYREDGHAPDCWLAALLKDPS